MKNYDITTVATAATSSAVGSTTSANHSSVDTMVAASLTPMGSAVRVPYERGRVLGYIRVSTRDQNEARQVDALQAFGVDRIFLDKQSGKDFDRPA